MSKTLTLTTERLVLRMPSEEDIDRVFAIMSDREIADKAGFRRMRDRSEAEGKVRNAMVTGDCLMITPKGDSSEVFGIVDLFYDTYDTPDGKRINYNIGYYLKREARGKGYMTEVVTMIKEHMFSGRGVDYLTIYIVPSNSQSRNVALKCGFRFFRMEKDGGMTAEREAVDLEYYMLSKEEYFNMEKESKKIIEKQKWINQGGVLFPIPGYASLLTTPGNGVFRIHVENPTGRLGLEKMDDVFSFNFKVYDLGCEDIMNRIIKTWSSPVFTESNKNLGVIFNGLKGTGKTIAAKLLSNRMGLPVIIISKPIDGMLEFIQSLCFECIILIDEAEKTFRDNHDVLLKMIDGVYNSTRKLYILTTNKLYLDENLLGRPGRIRYIKQFGNLSEKAVNDVIDDNLNDKSLKQGVLNLVDTLTISTIDI